MYIFIPLIIFLIATGYAVFAVRRKLEFLKKITPEAIQDRPASWQTFWSEMFPGVVSFSQRVEWQENKVHFLAESEKLLRRMRLLFLRLDASIHALINRLRHKTKREEAILEQQADDAVVMPIAIALDPKEEEQLLIMEIAKNPKDALLYRKLGDVYIKINNYEDAKQSFSKALELNPKDAYASRKLSWLAGIASKLPV